MHPTSSFAKRLPCCERLQGVRLDLSSVSPPANVTDLLHQQAQSSVLTRRYPGLEVSHVGSTEALKELAVAYDLGELPAVVTERI